MEVITYDTFESTLELNDNCDLASQLIPSGDSEVIPPKDVSHIDKKV